MTYLTAPIRRVAVDPNTCIMGIGVTAFTLLCVLFWPFVADDAYIVGRYALNAAAGDGLVYNVGERVSALTSPLHALLASAIARAGFHPVESYRLLALCLIVVGWAIAIRRTGIGGTRLALFTALSLGSPFLALWSVGGLETAILSLLATVFAAWLVVLGRAGSARDRDYLALGALAGMMFLTRHDSVLITGPLLLAILCVDYRRPMLWVGGLLCAAIAGSWLLFAWLYYGDVLPTSYYIKLAHSSRASIDSISALLNFALLSFLAPLALLWRPTRDTRPKLTSAIQIGGGVAFALFVFYASRSAGEHMMFGYRMFMPYLTAAALVVTLSLPNIRRAIVVIVSAVQAVMAAVVLTVGVNPAPLAGLPGLSAAYAEYQFVTPHAFGQFAKMLEADAEDIKDHWSAQGIETQPIAYLRTGGMGYHLPHFHILEALVSYRHDCGILIRPMIEAAHYTQQLGFSLTGTFVRDHTRTRPDVADDAALLFTSTLEWDRPAETGYLFGPNPAVLDLGDSLGARCHAPERPAAS
ncbi:hypothetical protein PARPLA_00596 [Rhodobacteraceae bacterium THAF1]|uniref:glycosyltransferase family 39 protein n=1 Tax=Palleronia sp. THAF1 TaxID=2587842 RepID=UPI000F3FEE7F|nr:glycosyltransferase family 39 protein [Palleronia sp. THAF1]QFU09841.1 hypothetical protein FIU81_14280 [Palleronia sp. THAF1]VDC17256.1 hypothetical protein PARPLA_00596 [Rhodobacteraceae bacterium THAF1]